MEYKLCSRHILDKELVKQYCKNADIVHHLAGITQVARVRSESNDEMDDKIKIIAEKGTQNILECYFRKM